LSEQPEGKKLLERPNRGQENAAKMYVNNNCVIVG